MDAAEIERLRFLEALGMSDGAGDFVVAREVTQGWIP